MEITKNTIKALASDTRLEILKILSNRRKIPADLAKMLDLAPSTVNGHLKILEEEGLVKRKETGHKWIYFEITEKGKNLVKPRSPMQFVLILSLGVLMMIVGGLKSVTQPATQMLQSSDSIEEFAIKSGDGVTRNMINQGASIDWFVVFVVLVGIFLVGMSLYNIWRIRNQSTVK